MRDAYGFRYPIVGEARSAARGPVISHLAGQATVAVLARRSADAAD